MYISKNKKQRVGLKEEDFQLEWNRLLEKEQ
jgi:hypothetical protein